MSVWEGRELERDTERGGAERGEGKNERGNEEGRVSESTGERGKEEERLRKEEGRPRQKIGEGAKRSIRVNGGKEASPKVVCNGEEEGRIDNSTSRQLVAAQGGSPVWRMRHALSAKWSSR